MSYQRSDEKDKTSSDARTPSAEAAALSTSIPKPNETPMARGCDPQDLTCASPKLIRKCSLKPLPSTLEPKPKSPAKSDGQSYAVVERRQLEVSGSDCPKNNISQHGEEENRSIPGIRLPYCMCDREVVDRLKDTTRLPPVTIETLQELDLQWIQNNVNLRVDVHYDHDLHFMPVSGRRGEEKRLDARKYWSCLETEFRVYQHDFKTDCQECLSRSSIVNFCPRLPSMFQELKKLLFILVPERERDQVDRTLDVELLMQQIRQNALDIVQLSGWLSHLLTTHCAPVRDEWAKDMAVKISEGARQGDMVSLVAGLEKLFSFCEAMKLDVANHQIRTFRIALIEDGVSFQRDYFSTRIQNGKFDIKSSHDWFADVNRQLFEKGEGETAGFDVLASGLIHLCVLPESDIPRSLKHDLTRLRQMQEEFQDILHLMICLKVFDQGVYSLCGPNSRPSAMHALLRTRIMDLTDCDAEAEGSTNDIWQTNTESIAIELTRALASVVRDAGREMLANQQLRVYADVLASRFRKEREDHTIAQHLATDLRRLVSEHAAVFRTMQPLRISEIQKQYQKDRQKVLSTRLMPDLEDISRRLAHTAVIHWQVWGDLVYQIGDSCVMNGLHRDFGYATEMEYSGHLDDNRRGYGITG